MDLRKTTVAILTAIGLALAVMATAVAQDTTAPGAAADSAAAATAKPERADLTNFRSGISLVIQGRNGEDYAVERFWPDPGVDDRCVIYIRDNVKMALEHNERNTAHSGTTAPWAEIGINGKDGKPASGDEGIIRYKLDRDQQIKYTWSEKKGKTHDPTNVLPRFEKPFAFADLEYEPGVKVVGAVGPKPGADPGPEFYYRGVRDAFGDEWHTITVADDDGAIQDDYYSHKWASDGKVLLFVVNPKTPCLGLVARTADAQYYTTPPKTYFLPRIHDQITYVTGGVDLTLTNVTNDKPVQYRLDGGDARAWTGPISSDTLSDGRHVLEYWFDGGAVKKRTIVKNPPYPSEGEKHGYLLWQDDAERDAIKARMDREPYKTTYQSCRTQWNGHASADRNLGRGRRTWVSAALENALVACFEGPDAKAPKEDRTYASYAKQMLLDNKLTLDPVGFELSHNFAPMPTAEWNTFGYYAVNDVYDTAFGYDLLISLYRADKVPGGITPIEDLKIRDLLARWIAVQLYELRGFEGEGLNAQKPSPSPGQGMWDMARLTGAAVAAMAMPAYDTPYYGTSGFDGARAHITEVPFAGQAFTWRELFIDADQPVAQTPKLRRRFNQLDGGLITEDGQFFDRPGYYSYHLMGHCFMILANTVKIRTGKSYPCLEKSFQRAIDGTLEGLKINAPGDKGPRRYVQILLVNSRFPAVSSAIYNYVKGQPGKRPDGQRNDDALGFQMYQARPYSLLWYQDDWQKPTM